MARSAWHSLAAVTASTALTCAASCSLLAPSDEEAMAGLAQKADAQTGETSVGGDTGVIGSADGSTDAAKETGSVVCPGCAVACNQGQCSACYLNGAPCATAAECCGGVCNAQHTCGAAAGSCTASNESCTTSPDSCCAGSTCSVDRGNRCDSCKPANDNCKADTDCCTINCSNGQCKACIATGASCTRARQCCSGVCNGGTCG